MKKRIYYHCTNFDHGLFLEVKRKPPSHMSDDEPKTPRLCVCPTIPQCFTARLFLHGPVFVYKTMEPISGIKPKFVWDLFITEEKWIIPPTQLVCCEVISHDLVIKAQKLIRTYHAITRKRSCFMSRLIQLNEAYSFLAAKTPRWLQDSIKKHDPYKELLNVRAS